MRKFPLLVFFVGLSFGIGVGAWRGVSTWLDWINEPRPVIPASAPIAAAPPAPISVMPAVAPLTTGSQHRVTNTEGQGVALRASPGGDRLPGKGYDDGDVLTVLEQQGEWTHIRGADGRDGWVLTVTLGS
jgi:hypothetical protein